MSLMQEKYLSGEERALGETEVEVIGEAEALCLSHSCRRDRCVSIYMM